MEWSHHLFSEHPEVSRDPAVSAFHLFIMAPLLLICILKTQDLLGAEPLPPL